MSSPLRADYDPTHYPVDDDMGESLLQRNLTEELRTSIATLISERGDLALVGANQFIYYEQFNPTKAVAPDVYVLPGIPADTPVKAWKVWERAGLVPSFAFELVSTEVWKDYEISPRRYAELGTAELCVFDPEFRAQRQQRARWQVFRRVDGEFILVDRTNEDRVRSSTLACWLRAVGKGAACRVRLATDPDGGIVIPSALEAERAAKEAERAAKEAERAAKEEAEAEVARLRAELERLRGFRPM